MLTHESFSPARAYPAKAPLLNEIFINRAFMQNHFDRAEPWQFA